MDAFDLPAGGFLRSFSNSLKSSPLGHLRGDRSTRGHLGERDLPFRMPRIPSLDVVSKRMIGTVDENGNAVSSPLKVTDQAHGDTLPNRLLTNSVPSGTSRRDDGLVGFECLGRKDLGNRPPTMESKHRFFSP